MGEVVAADFVARRITPLQAHSEPMWMYAGPSDPMRLHPEDLGSDVVDTILNILFASPDVPGKIAGSVRPLHQLPLSDRVDILDGMPDFTPHGLA